MFLDNENEFLFSEGLRDAVRCRLRSQCAYMFPKNLELERWSLYVI